MAPRATAQRRKRRTASEEKAQHEESLHAYEDTFLECRDLKHSWKRQGAWNEGTRICRRLVCTRCEMVRIDRWRPNGYREVPRYIPPPGYYLKGDSYTPVEVRREVISRIELFGSEADLMASLTGRRSRRSTNGKVRQLRRTA